MLPAVLAAGGLKAPCGREYQYDGSGPPPSILLADEVIDPPMCSYPPGVDGEATDPAGDPMLGRLLNPAGDVRLCSDVDSTLFRPW